MAIISDIPYTKLKSTVINLMTLYDYLNICHVNFIHFIYFCLLSLAVKYMFFFFFLADKIIFVICLYST